jgi:hypothetical protein
MKCARSHKCSICAWCTYDTVQANSRELQPSKQLGLTYYIFWITDFQHHFGRSGGGNKKKQQPLSTPHFILQGLQTFFCYLVGRRE